MKLTKEKIFGYIGSLIFCAIMLLILWFSVLKTIVPEKEVGVLVNFGNVDEAFGEIEPWNLGSNDEPDVPEIPVQTTPTESPTVITQNIEQTASIDAENKKKEEEKRKQEQDTMHINQQQRKRPRSRSARER